MPKIPGQRYKVISGEHETIVTEISFYAAAVLAIRMFDLKNTCKPKKLGPVVMVTAMKDGEWEVVDTQFVLNEIGLKYDRILHEGNDDAENSDSECNKSKRRNITIFPVTD